MTKKNKQILIGILVIIVGVGGIVALLAYAFRVTAETEWPFVHERRHSAQRLYNETIGRNILENYPTTPRELMEAYAASVLFLYGDFIALDSVFMQAIEFQRHLFSDGLRASITAEEQFLNLSANLAELGYANIMVRRPEIYEIAFDFVDQRSALVEVRHRFVGHDYMYRLYHVALDDADLWRIMSWAVTDSDFNLPEDANE
ncbi:MAG: hypothetical protein LBE35_02635 [Clostridiales bacterium]|jgi:hypothetical protein|nr:hypothetical protein [Clostridiales bacterium]